MSRPAFELPLADPLADPLAGPRADPRTQGTRPQSPAARGPMVDQPRGFDLLRLPGVRRFVRWRYARLAFQLPLLLLAVLVIVDGLTGRQIAPRNVATTATWLHYRGLLVIGIAIVGNAFCAACPLMLTRGPSRWLASLMPRRLAWPKALRSKWLVIGLLVAFFVSYEVFDFWASPWLTAWLALGYFAAALLVDVVFPAGTFCRYVCPLGNFNFTLATVSPSQITAIDADVCRSCVEKPCLHGRHSGAAATAGADTAFIPLSEIVNANGAGRFPGCETDLFVPTITSNMDCTLCFNCVRACPYDNVALTLRSPGRELSRSPWLKRGRLSVMVMGVLLTFWGVMNALAMITPFYSFAENLATWLGTRSEALLLILLYAGISVLGMGASLAVMLAADAAGGTRPRPRRALERWGYVVVALGFGFWGAHYTFHFLTGALSIVPVFQHFFEFRGFDVDPNWRLAQVVPSRWLFGIQAFISAAAAAIALATVWRIANRDFGKRGVLAMWPMVLFVLAFTAMQLLILAQPMEMRGTVLGPTF